MDPGPPDGKRPRLSSWSASTAPASSLPHPHAASATHQHPHPPPPHRPPPPPAHHPQHHPAPSPYQQPYPPRSAELASVPPPPPPAPIHGHAQQQLPPQHPDLDRRHHEQETLAPMQDYRQQQQQQQQPLSPAHPPPYHQYASRDSVIKREVGEDPRRPNSTGHAPEPLPPTPHAVSAPQPPAPLQPVAYQAEAQPRHMSYDNGPSVPPTPGVYRAPTFPPPTPSHQSSYESHGGYPSATETFYSVYSSVSSAKKKNTRASQVRLPQARMFCHAGERLTLRLKGL